jgi:PAS domain S-box-containing protein
MARGDDGLDVMRRSFQVAVGVLLMVIISVAVLLASEINRPRWISHQVSVTALVALLLEVILLAVLFHRFRMSAARQTRRIKAQRDALAAQQDKASQRNVELEVTVEHLKHSEERFRTLVGSMSDIVYTIDIEGRYDSLLGAWVEREKIDPALFLGRTVTEIFGKEHGVMHRVATERALRGEHVVYDWSTKPGPAQRFFTTALSPLRNPRGEIIGAVGVGREITERHRKDAELANAQERLRHAQKLEAVGQLAGGVAHDFNNVLTVITAYSDMLALEIPQSDPKREPINEIRQAANRAAALTRQLLAFSRRQQLHPRIVDVNEVIEGIENLIARLLGPEHRLVLHLSPEIEAVIADPGHLEQVLMNFAANARDAMSLPGEFTLTTSRIVLDEAGARSAGMPAGIYTLIEARDTGAGMSPETQARLFEPFFTTKEVGKGTGLGLATVYGIVEQSRGHIRVDSSLGNGATFLIYLPSMRTHLTPSSLTATPVSNTVLLVDDEPAVRAATAKLLRESGYAVLEAADGEEALRMLRNSAAQIGTVLTDMVMPGLSGRELAQRIRHDFPSVAVAIMSGFIRESMMHDPGLRAGIAFVEKPFTLFTLTAALREASRNVNHH